MTEERIKEWARNTPFGWTREHTKTKENLIRTVAAEARKEQDREIERQRRHRKWALKKARKYMTNLRGWFGKQIRIVPISDERNHAEKAGAECERLRGEVRKGNLMLSAAEDRAEKAEAEVRAWKKIADQEQIWKQKANAELSACKERVRELEKVSQALIDDIHRRYPGEDLRCPYMKAIEKALQAQEQSEEMGG